MKISELKRHLEKHSEEQLRFIIKELYKAIPKQHKEDRQIDALIEDPQGFLSPGKTQKTPPPDFDSLKEEIETFIDYVNKDYYFVPNRVVPKKQRSQWRFLVKRFHKDLIVIANQNERDLPAVAELLEKFYNLLCHGCGYYIFKTDDPFRSVGIPQREFYKQVLSLNFRFQSKPQFITNALKLVVNNYLDRETLKEGLLLKLLEFLKTPDLKEMGITRAELLLSEMKKEWESKTRKSKSRRVSIITEKDRSEFWLKYNIGKLAIFGFYCYITLYEHEEAIRFYKQHYMEDSEEVKLYVLLNLLFHYKLKDYWLREYENAVKRGVKARERLQEMYRYITEKGEFPQYMF